MGKFKKIVRHFFENHAPNSGNGLFASLEELMDMRQYARYLKTNHVHQSYSKESGNLRSAFKGRGIEMEELRAYQFGDDVRDIDWRVTARKEQPYTRVYQEERDLEIYVWLDLSSLMLFGSQKELKSVTASKIAALLAWASIENKDRFGCAVFDGEETYFFKARRDVPYLTAILKKISEVSQKALQQPKSDSEARLKSLRRLQLETKNKVPLFVISSFLGWGDAFDRELALLSQRTKLYLIDVFDSLEVKAPSSGQYMAAYGGQKLVLDSSDKKYRHVYAAYFEKLRQQREDFCKRFGCHFIHFSSKQSFMRDLKIF